MTEKHFKQIITYDIPTDKLRAKVARILEDHGLERLQYSVFIGSVTREVIENIVLELEEIINGKEADVRVFYICNHIKPNQEIIAMRQGSLGEKNEIPEVIAF